VSTATIPSINPPLKWHGGKHYLARHIHALARQTPYTHRVITHAGGLGELWGWEFDEVSEVVNDRNGWLTNFWGVLRDPETFQQLRRVLEATPFSEPDYQVSVAEMKETPLAPREDIDRVFAAAQFFVACRQSMAGRMDSFAPLSRNRTRRRMNEQASAWLTAIEGLPAAHDRLKRVVVFNKDALKVIEQQDGPATLFYCDPPYLDETRTSPDVYTFEMTPLQHGELLRALQRIQGKFILSGYDSQLYRDAERLGGWSRQEVDLPNNAAGGASKRRMREVLWFNFPAEAPDAR
jgi:DNA adenine methylase